MIIRCSPGELVDRYCIYLIKSKRIPDTKVAEAAQAHVHEIAQEWQASNHPQIKSLPPWKELLRVNEELWEAEDKIRNHERASDFGEDFIRLARAIYTLNDIRSSLKQEIDRFLDSPTIEQKYYGIE